MPTPLKSLDQLMPFATCAELIAKKQKPTISISPDNSYRDIFAVTLIKSAAVFVVIGVFYVTGIY